VLIEVTIAEVNLTDELQFGVEWLFRGGAPSGRGAGGLFNTTQAFNPGAGTTPAKTLGSSIAQGFVYFINNAAFPGGVQAVLNLLDTYGNTKVVANPHIAALDNQKATIKAGNRIPINQSTLVGGTTNAVTTTAQYIDTGVLLQVTPHINAGGLVALEVQAEVSNPGNPAQPGDAPPINTRSVQTYVSVQSGQTMVMGGLIGDTRQNNSEGLPLLARIPFLGGLFGNQTLKYDRTELVLFITPRVVESEVDVRGAIDEMRRKMENLDRLFPYIPPFTSQVFPPERTPPLSPGLAPLPAAP
jgi:general secretion pathway protein D